MHASDNLLLSALPPEELAEIESIARIEPLKLGDVLYEQDELVRDAYFPGSGAVSVLVALADGRAMEPAIIGREGMLGFPLGLGDNRSRWRSVVQLEGEALVVPRERLSEHLRRPGHLAPLLTHYAGLLITFTAQSATCAQFHELEQRAARWLLIMHDRARGDEIEITHEWLAYMLGTHRPTITVALNSLRDRELITLGRGRVRVTHRTALEAAACECYERLEHDYRELVRVTPPEGNTYQPRS